MRVLPIVNKARKPKFELHLSIYDLNNVPLVAGTSYVKWHLPASMHGEHRGRTSKCSIDKIHHRVSYNYSKIIPIRISIDRNNNLTECPIEFEVLQEFPMVSGGRDEKISLGFVRLNLSEYVEESENFPRRSTSSRAAGSPEHVRQNFSQNRRPSSSRGADNPVSPTSLMPAPHLEESDVVDEEAEEGIVRRYLMQESKINSTLKIGILMVQIDGERNYVSPPLKTAPMFGGIAGIMTGEQAEKDDPEPGGALPVLNKSRDAYELQDMYRRTLAASWLCQPGELPADECIEDIFSGGSGWRDSTVIRTSKGSRSSQTSSPDSRRTRSSGSGSASGDGDEVAAGTLRPSDIRQMQHHLRQHSGASDRSGLTVIGGGASGTNARHRSGSGHQHSNTPFRRGSNHSQPSRYTYQKNTISEEDLAILHDSNDHEPDDRANNRQSLISMAPTIGSERTLSSSSSRGGRGRDGFRRPREVDEYEVRDDMIAWTLPGAVG
ncbi:N-terminal C2 in EEIG1 and EHBP1 proteins-domain-containing protein [Biscogniauxia marginata]|nr:N-terminal C2 in EEIG1 and EHBP1 proteins-domain-containing protein [Biscogniauxia marginata]